MKSNKQVAKEFAEGATSGSATSMFIEGDTIYSYGHHFPIARRITKRKAYFTTRGYSRSTAKHKGCVHYALIEAGVSIQEVDDVEKGIKTKPEIIAEVVEALRW